MAEEHDRETAQQGATRRMKTGAKKTVPKQTNEPTEESMSSAEIRSELQQAGEQAREERERTVDQMDDAMDHIQGEAARLAGDLTATARAAASEMGQAAQSDVRAVGNQAAWQAAQGAHTAKKATAQKLHAAAEAVRQRTALRDANVIDRAAGRLDGLATYVQEREFKQMKADFENSVKRAPLVAVFLSVLVGLLMGKLTKRG